MNPLQTAVETAVRALVAEHGPLDAGGAYAALWPYVREAVAQLAPRAAPAPPPAAGDRRVRRWQYTARFWDAAGDLIAETDPEVMEGTGNVPRILASLGEQLHEFVPPELHPDVTRPRLTQVRNNLGRSGRTTLRVAYADGAGDAHLCQMDIHRLEG